MLVVGQPRFVSASVFHKTIERDTCVRNWLSTNLLCLVVCALLTAASAPGQDRKATTPEKKAQVLATIDLLETDPYHKDAKAYRAGVLAWLTDAPDVTVKLCADVLGDIKKMKGDDGAALFGQLAFSEAKFILQNPDMASDDFAVNMAGVDGVLKTYDAMKKARPKVKFDNLEQLIELRVQNQLDASVRAALAKCH